MKTSICLALAVALAFTATAFPAATPAAPAPAASVAPKNAESKEATAAAAVIPASAAEITAPFTLKDGVVSQPEQTEVEAGGKAVFTFTVPKDGDYVIHAIANAPDEGSNSYFLNIDAKPEDPLMIWDLDVTIGYEERIVSWRGNGDPSSNEFVPKVFKLTAGEHKLIIIGREPGQLKSVSIRPAKK